jgi:ABC-type multidrug transport system permease subunit
MFVVGMLCFAISIILVRILPRWGGFLLIAGNLVFALGSAAGNKELITSVLGAAITASGFIWLGISLIKMKEVENLPYQANGRSS